MSTTYFGNNSYSEYNDNYNGYWGRLSSSNSGCTCPGSGLQNVKELGIVACVNAGTGVSRLAIYDALNNFVMQGLAAVNVTETTPTWKTHSSFADQSGNAMATPQLTGGVRYALVCSGSTDVTLWHGYNYQESTDNDYGIADYTGGFPASLGYGTSMGTFCVAMRCGVEPASNSISIPALMATNMRGGFNQLAGGFIN